MLDPDYNGLPTKKVYRRSSEDIHHIYPTSLMVWIICGVLVTCMWLVYGIYLSLGATGLHRVFHFDVNTMCFMC